MPVPAAAVPPHVCGSPAHTSCLQLLLAGGASTSTHAVAGTPATDGTANTTAAIPHSQPPRAPALHMSMAGRQHGE